MSDDQPELVAEVTPAMIKGEMFEYAAHYNMGKSGYAYGYRCLRYPRLYFIDRYFRPTREKPDGENERTWHVDGAPCLNMGDALAALAAWPVLTEDELRILALLPADFAPARATEDDLAGVPHPKNGIEPNTPHARVLDWIRALHNKGLVEYGKMPERGDGKLWSESVPERLRWSTTIRRSRYAEHYLNSKG